MFVVSTHRTLINALLICCLFLSINSQAETSSKPSLAEVIKTAIETDGPAAAQKKFKEIYPQHKDDYNLDSQALMQLVSEYANAGNMEAAQVVGEIFSTLSQDLMQVQMAQYQPELERQIAQQKALKKEQTAAASPKKDSAELPQIEESKSRDDLDRFTGLYGDPNKPDSHRQFWVTKSCDGKLVIGATWGDASPWWMNSETDNRFTYHDSFSNLSMNFTTNSEGQATELAHDLKAMASPLKRVGPLTADYSKCIEPFKR